MYLLSCLLSVLCRQLCECDVSSIAQRIVGQNSQKGTLAYLLIAKCNQMRKDILVFLAYCI